MTTKFNKIGDLLNKKNKNGVKPPFYPWQELALKIIKELNIPDFKRSSVFKVCKECDKIFIERCLTDTRELCQNGLKWKYFFKIVNNDSKEFR